MIKRIKVIDYNYKELFCIRTGEIEPGEYEGDIIDISKGNKGLNPAIILTFSIKCGSKIEVIKEYFIEDSDEMDKLVAILHQIYGFDVEMIDLSEITNTPMIVEIGKKIANGKPVTTVIGCKKDLKKMYEYEEIQSQEDWIRRTYSFKENKDER